MASRKRRVRGTFAGEIDPPNPERPREMTEKALPVHTTPGNTSRYIGLIARKISELMKIQDFDLKNIATTVISLSKQVTSSNWAEFFYLDGDVLKLCTTTSGLQKEVRQSITSVSLVDESLPGYSTLRKESMVINNTYNSPMYTAFKYKFASFSRFMEAEDPHSVACIPILIEEQQVFAVVHLFDKVDEHNSLAQFTDEDVKIVESIGLLISGMLSMKGFQKSTQRYIENLEYFNSHRHNMTAVSLHMLRKQSLFQTLEHVLSESQALTYEQVDLMAEAMESEAVLVHLLSKEGVMCPWIVFGVKLKCEEKDEVRALCTRTSEYISTEVGDLLLVRDYSKEKHFGSSTFNCWDKAFVNSLSLPISSDGELQGIIEFYRSGNEFTFKDQHMAKVLVSFLSKIHPNRYYSRLPLSGMREKERAKSYTIQGKSMLQAVREFSMRPESFNFDFVGYLRQARNSIRDLIKIESCNLYIRDALTDSIWTWVSYNCQVLNMSISPHTILGYSIIKKQVICEQFPCGNKELDVIMDVEHMDRSAVLVIPVIGEALKGQVLAVVMITRKDAKFSPEEVALVSKLMRLIGYTLETLFCSNYQLKEELPKIEIPTPPTSPRRKKERFSTFQTTLDLPRKLDDPEYSQNVKRSRLLKQQETNLEEPHDLMLRFLCQISALSNARFHSLKSWLACLDSHPERVLELLLQGLPELVPCQHAKVFIVNDSHMYIRDLETQTLCQPIGLVKQVLETGKSLKLNANVVTNPVFNQALDSLGIPAAVDTFMAVPIYHIYGQVIGVIAFVNSRVCFSNEDLAVAQFLSLIPSKAIMGMDESMKKWNDVLKEGLRQEMLLAWCKHVVAVSAICQQTVSNLQEIAQDLTDSSDFPTIIKALLEVICANMNVEEAQLIIRHHDGYLAAFTRTKGLQLLQAGEETEMIKDILQSGRASATLENSFGYTNTLIIPIRSGADIIGGIELNNKKDATLSFHCSFTNEDRVIIQNYAIKLRDPVAQWVKDDKVDTVHLRKMINVAASNVNAYPLVSVIRKAALLLLGCDRSTIYIRDKDKMVVMAQGIEQEIPEGYSVPLGVGIVGYVAQSRQTVNLTDAHNDPRFNQEVDDLTGYRTASMLCVPVLDSNHEVIAALQMINKQHGAFDDDDIKILDMFSDVISSALQIFHRFKKVVGENMQLLSLLNSIETYILVINKAGNMEYCNQKFEVLFGITEDVGRTRHFSFWLRENPDLLRDMQSVIDSPTTKITREFQNLRHLGLRKSSSIKSSAAKEHADINIHYNIMSMYDLATQESAGLILIIEDVTKIVKMKTDLKLMKSQLKQLQVSTAVQAETGLYTCITTLQHLYDSMPNLNSAQTTESLEKVISILKSGNLEKAEVYFSANGSQADADLRLFIDKEFLGRDFHEEGHIESPVSMPQLQGAQGVSDVSILRSWNLDVWELGDLFGHIVSMFTDRSLFPSFDIKTPVIMNFLTEIQRLYDHRQNHFHNFHHGFNVMHSMYFLFTATKVQTWFSAEDTFGVLLASLCHDVDHTGRTNSFEVSKGSNLALLYHDIAVLEQHHAAITFFTLQQDACNILKFFPKDVYHCIRKTVISGILGTDMSKHFPMLLKMNLRFKDVQEAPIGTREHDKLDMVELLVHGCDLAHITKTFSICAHWSQLLRLEMTDQTHEEEVLGLPVTPFMRDLADVRSYLKNEINFTTVIVQPLWECVDQGLQPYTAQQVKNLKENIQSYKDRLATEEAAHGSI